MSPHCGQTAAGMPVMRTRKPSRSRQFVILSGAKNLSRNDEILRSAQNDSW
jgi:hypothetical protein